MSAPKFNFNTLLTEMQQLERSLLFWRWQAPDLQPISHYTIAELQSFIGDLYVLAAECLHMHHRKNTEKISTYRPDYNAAMNDRLDLIALTRELLFCCNEKLIEEYRMITLKEAAILRVLEQTHAQLIGAVYYCRPGELTLPSDDYYFQ